MSRKAEQVIKIGLAADNGDGIVTPPDAKRGWGDDPLHIGAAWRRLYTVAPAELLRLVLTFSPRSRFTRIAWGWYTIGLRPPFDTSALLHGGRDVRPPAWVSAAKRLDIVAYGEADRREAQP